MLAKKKREKEYNSYLLSTLYASDLKFFFAGVSLIYMSTSSSDRREKKRTILRIENWTCPSDWDSDRYYSE